MAKAVSETRAAGAELKTIGTSFVEGLSKKLGYGHPLSDRTGTLECTWSAEALARLEQVPEFCRELTRWRVEWTAHKLGLGSVITPEIMDVKYELWREVSHQIEARDAYALPWTGAAAKRLEKVPEFVRGQVIQAIEGNARAMGRLDVTDEIVDLVIAKWSRTGDFHEGRYGFH